MSDVVDHRTRLANARADLLEGQGLERSGVPDHVAASWRRSVEHGVSPSSVETRYVTELDFGARLVLCARPVIDELCEQLGDVPMCVALTDSRARIIARKDSSGWISRFFDRVYFARGFDYAEAAVGTNGVGTVLESGASVQIVGAEHFVDTLQCFACAGAPVRDPITGRIEGVLDISCLSQHSTPIMHSLVRSAARRVERNLVLDRNQAQQALFEVFSRVDARTRAAVVGVGPQILMSNTAMQTLLSSSDQAALSDHMRFLMGRRHRHVDDRINLPSGTSVRVRGSTTDCGDDIAGMVGVVTISDPMPSGSTTSPSVSTARRRRGPVDAHATTEAGSPAWRAAAAGVATAIRAGRPILVLGERGSGRHTLVTEAFAAQHAVYRVLTLDAHQVNADPGQGVAALTPPSATPTLLVLRDIDRVTPTAGAALSAALAGRTGAPLQLTATAMPTQTSRDQPLLALFDESVTVPPLRHRSTELLALVRAILDDLEPHRQVRLSDEVLRVLSRHSWPGNVRELREVLTSALGRRPVGTIEPQDLPAYCQSEPRSTLRAVDKVERDAIVLALREAHGNRRMAATALGIARSTLYRKIREYGVTT